MYFGKMNTGRHKIMNNFDIPVYNKQYNRQLDVAANVRTLQPLLNHDIVIVLYCPSRKAAFPLIQGKRHFTLTSQKFRVAF